MGRDVVSAKLDIIFKVTPHKCLYIREKWYNEISMSELSDELLKKDKEKRISRTDRTHRSVGGVDIIHKPCYYKGERGNKPYNLGLMLRIYLIQNLYDLAYEATVSEIMDGRAFSKFCGVESSNQIPDGDTLGRFRNLLIKTDFKRNCLNKWLKC